MLACFYMIKVTKMKFVHHLLTINANVTKLIMKLIIRFRFLIESKGTSYCTVV